VQPTRRRNVATGVALALLGGGALGALAHFPLDGPPATDPALFPRSIAVGLIIIGIVLTAVALVSHRMGSVIDDDGEGIPIDVDVPDKLANDAPTEETDGKAAFLLTITIGAYCFTAFSIGFVTMTVLFLVFVALLLGHSRNARGLLTLAVFTVLTTATFYFGFFTLLGVRLPTTILF